MISVPHMRVVGDAPTIPAPPPAAAPPVDTAALARRAERRLNIRRLRAELAQLEDAERPDADRETETLSDRAIGEIDHHVGVLARHFGLVRTGGR